MIAIANQDNLLITLATHMESIIRDQSIKPDEGMLHHTEGVDLIPANIELSGMEMLLVNAMSRETTLKTCLEPLKGMTQLIQTIKKSTTTNQSVFESRWNAAYACGYADKSSRVTENILKENYGKFIKVYQIVNPVAVKVAETSAAGRSIYSYDKDSTVAKAYQAFTKKVVWDGERQRNQLQSSLCR